MEQLTSCLACGAPSATAVVVHRRRDDALVRCPQCRLMYANPQYTHDELDHLYTVEYYDEHKNLDTDYRERDYQYNLPLHRAVLGDLIRRYPRLDPARRRVRVLDYGSGVGFFLAVCRDRGMVGLGIDFSDVASRYAAQRFGIEVRTDPDRAVRALPDGGFDLVTAWEVVEHLKRPREALAELVRVLAPGGVLALTVPNLGCWRYRIEGARWFNIQNLTHLAFFDQRGLTELLGELGLERVRRSVFWGGRADFGLLANSAQYVARWLKLGSNLRLYAEKAA